MIRFCTVVLGTFVVGAQGGDGDSTKALITKILLPTSGVMLLSLFVASLLNRFRYTRSIPESAVQVIVSGILGVMAHNALQGGLIAPDDLVNIIYVTLKIALLPIIVFVGGWGVEKSDFMNQLGPIALLSVVGTVINTTLVAFVIYGLAPHVTDSSPDLRECLVFGALLSAIENVAPIATFEEYGLPEKEPVLSSMVFGETMISETFAIVLFDQFNDHPLEDLMSLKPIGEFCLQLLASPMLGGALAMILVKLLRLGGVHHDHMVQILFMFVSAYFIYLSALTLGLSGVIANLFAGMVFGLYGSLHLDERGQHEADIVLEVIGRFADDAIFLLCGVSIALVSSALEFRFAFFVMVSLFVARAVVVFSCCSVSNGMNRCVGDSGRITWKHQVMMWHAGLRGGVSLVLSLHIKEWCVNRDMFFHSTLVILVSLLLLCGSTTGWCLSLLGLPEERSEGSRPLMPSLRRCPTVLAPPADLRPIRKLTFALDASMRKGVTHLSEVPLVLSTLRSDTCGEVRLVTGS